MKAALALIAISTLNALMASPAPGDEFRPAKNVIAEGTNARLVELPTKGGVRGRREARARPAAFRISTLRPAMLG